jgi:hypothetical protein
MLTKGAVKIGLNWRFGPNWPGQRCEARTRKGTACQRPARLPVGRCRLHGGSSTGPTTEEGLARLTASKIKHGKFTKEKRAAARRRAEQGRQMRAELLELETWFLDRGLLDTNWRKDWEL